MAYSCDYSPCLLEIHVAAGMDAAVIYMALSPVHTPMGWRDHIPRTSRRKTHYSARGHTHAAQPNSAETGDFCDIFELGDFR